jgi:photosystem II stability/assembly factor-like uncharacterized protein
MLPHRIYVGTIGEGVWRSLDGGDSFARAADGMFVECHVRALAVHPHDDRVLYLGSELGLFRSTSGADSWQQVDSPCNGRQIWSILISPRQPDTILVGACPSRIFRSTDAGKTWLEAAADIRPDCPRILHTRVTTLEADPDHDQVFWAGIEIDGIHRSDDDGRTWRRLPGSGLLSQDIHDLLFVRHQGERIMLAATNADLHRSTDDGRTWQPLGLKSSLPWQYCRTLAQPVGQPGTVLLGHGNGPPGTEGLVGISSDGGLRWRGAEFPGQANSTIWNIAVHRAEPRLIYAASVSGQLYRSTDGGASWRKLPREFGEIRALAWTPLAE